jgi:peroxiredoxin Q/BCP
MASIDKIDETTAFAKKNAATFPILSDADKTAATASGVLGTHGYASRWTFYIDPRGRVVHIDKEVSALRAGADIVATLERLGVNRDRARD